MANAVFTTSESSAYDDQPEIRYHFPKTYLAQAEQAIGDWILYYEPRRTTGPSSSGGRQAYFAAARVSSIQRDPDLANHYYAYVKDFIELDQAVGFRDGDFYRESQLKKADGSTNRGAFGRAVRPIPRHEFEAIVRAGLSTEPDRWDLPDRIDEPVAAYEVHPVIERLVSRKYRDLAFRRHVRAAYSNRCAVTGLRLINGGGRPEVQAAHIRSVEQDGPDTVRNGLALTGTMHWLFDRGLMSVEDDYGIMLSPQGTPDDMERLIPEARRLILPDAPELRPHPVFLRWHREHCYKT
jgi:putative restriction endonuclease